MCLSRILNEKPEGKGIGYKVFKTTDTKDIFLPEYYNNSSNTYELGKTYENKDKSELQISAFTYYKSGFHIYVNKKDAKRWSDLDGKRGKRRFSKVVKVSYSGARILGIDSIYKTIIADEITLLEVCK